MITSITRFYDDLLASIPESSRNAPVRGVFMGHHWTLVCTDKAGIAYTYRSRHSPPPGEAGAMTGKSARELAQYLKSWNLLEASIGLATLNSLCTLDGDRINAYGYALERAHGKKVAVIGHFPFLAKLKSVCEMLWVMEMDPQEDELPSAAAEEFLPLADIALITGTAFINKTAPRLLELSRNAETILLGPSVPMVPALFDYGADVIGGVRVVDAEFLIPRILQGATKISQLQAGIEFILAKKP